MWKFEACLKGFGFVFQKDILLSHMANVKSASSQRQIYEELLILEKYSQCEV